MFGMAVAVTVTVGFCILSVCVFYIQKKGGEKKRLARIADQEAAKKKTDEQALASKEAEEAQRVREEAQQKLPRVGSHGEMLGNRDQLMISGKGTSFCNIKSTPRMWCARST